MKIVVKVGGSAIAQGIDARRYREYADVIKQLAKDHTVLIVIGGGTPARDYISASKALGANNSILDYVGIGVSRLNARLLISALGDIAYVRMLNLGEKKDSYWTGGFSGRTITDWRKSKRESGGGIVITNLIHHLDLARAITGLEAARAYSEVSKM
jgi:hypothetical protein